MIFSFKSMDFELSRLLSVMWVGLIYSVKGLKVMKDQPPTGRRNSAADSPSA